MYDTSTTQSRLRAVVLLRTTHRMYETYCTYRCAPTPENREAFAAAILRTVRDSENHGCRVAAVIARLLHLDLLTEPALHAYLRRAIRGAAHDYQDWANRLGFGPSLATRRKRLKRGAPEGTRSAVEWPSDSEGPVTRAEQDGSRVGASPEWMEQPDRGHYYRLLERWVAVNAPTLATGDQQLAVQSVLEGHSDERAARAIGTSPSTWGRRRRKAMEALGAVLVDAMPYDVWVAYRRVILGYHDIF